MSAAQVKEERLYKVLLSPIISEKATRLTEKRNQYAFQVTPDATKPEIKAAVELLFKVDVTGVQVVNIKGKSKRFGRFMGRRNNVRKAYVSVHQDQAISFAAEAP